jgi:hypothetical protein
MNRLEKCNIEMKQTINQNSQWEFPDFLTRLRECLNLSRKVVSEELHIPYLKLFYLELGSFMKPLEPSLVKKLSVYFGVDPNLMQEKMIGYLQRKRNEIFPKSGPVIKKPKGPPHRFKKKNAHLIAQIEEKIPIENLEEKKDENGKIDHFIINAQPENPIQ